MRPPITMEMQEVLELIQNPESDSEVKAAAKRRRLRLLGKGGWAKIYEHPKDPYKVIRVSVVNKGLRSPYDGWFAYAEKCRRRENGSEFAPKLYDLVHVGYPGSGVWIAISERLEELGPGPTWPMDFEVMEAVQRKQFTYKTPALGDEELMEKYQPGLLNFLDSHCAGMIDFHIDNLMKRGDTMVINDPDCDPSPTVMRALEEVYTIKDRPMATAEIVLEEAAGGMMP